MTSKDSGSVLESFRASMGGTLILFKKELYKHFKINIPGTEDDELPF